MQRKSICINTTTFKVREHRQRTGDKIVWSTYVKGYIYMWNRTKTACNFFRILWLLRFSRSVQWRGDEARQMSLSCLLLRIVYWERLTINACVLCRRSSMGSSTPHPFPFSLASDIPPPQLLFSFTSPSLDDGSLKFLFLYFVSSISLDPAIYVPCVLYRGRQF